MNRSDAEFEAFQEHGSPRNCCAKAGKDFHCSLCHRSFSSLENFDHHQNVSYKRQPPVICRDPAGMGLVQDYKGVWCSERAAAFRLQRAQNVPRGRPAA